MMQSHLAASRGPRRAGDDARTGCGACAAGVNAGQWVPKRRETGAGIAEDGSVAAAQLPRRATVTGMMWQPEDTVGRGTRSLVMLARVV